jgi:Tat protein secretion system quality control protein TatD with DNase activity
MKLFDAHNHIHLGPRGLSPLLETLALEKSNLQISAQVHSTATFAGAAIMSTHPRDYSHVESVVSDLRKNNYKAVPCYGIHPWFLNDVLTDPESTRVLENGDEVWLDDLKLRLIQQPGAIVGEIGLDGARWKEVEDNTYDIDDENDGKNHNDKSIWERQRVMACPMHLQKDAFVKQLLLAVELKRPVSIHVVRAWGELFDSLNEVREITKQKIERVRAIESEKTDNTLRKHKKPTRIKEALLPPKMYFHAFSGKAGVVPSLLAACAKGNIDPNSDVYFGFAPAIPNFYAPKTPSIMREIGLHRLLLETDLEDATFAWDDLIRCLEGIANALEVDVNEVADETYRNAECFYFNNCKAGDF